MGIGKSKITPSINIDDMLKKAESNHEWRLHELQSSKPDQNIKKVLIIQKEVSKKMAAKFSRFSELCFLIC